MWRKEGFAAIATLAISSALFLLGTAQVRSGPLPALFLNAARTSVPLSEEDTRRCFNGSISQSNAVSREDHSYLSAEFSDAGRRGKLIIDARKEAIEILEGRNACAAWFQESDPRAADVFRSLHFQVDREGPSSIESLQDALGNISYQHPWGAKSLQDAGSDAFVWINGNGPFFIRQTRLQAHANRLSATGSWRRLIVGPYLGDTPEARITIMLHELGHIIGRIPEDSSRRTESSSNTDEVLRHCKRDVDFVARGETRRSKRN